VRLAFKDFPLPSHRLARPAHEAARCAARDGQFWPYRRRLFEVQPRFEREALIGYAVDLGLDRARFTRCLDSHATAREVEADVAEARALGIRGTPTFLINGKLLVGAQPVETFRAAIDDAIQRAR
jgi:protein-disulfide isomerase